MSKVSYSPRQKFAIIAAVRIQLAEGKSLHAIAGEMRMAQSCLAKWLNPPEPKPSGKIGRPRKLVLEPAETQALKRLLLDHKSLPAAAFKIMTDPATSQTTREALGRIYSKAGAEGKPLVWPACLLEASRLPEVIEALHRGPKHARTLQPKARRNGELEMEDGTIIHWAPGLMYESDDMSVNEPFRYMDAGLGHETAGRQGLFSIDSASAFNLQEDLCGRPFDAYRAEDIADHFLNVVEAHGLPLFWRLEMGSWAGNFVEGIAIKDRAERWGSLHDLFYVRHKHESTGKANIERSFHESQKLSAHASTHLGRSRGEFELATKLYAKAQGGNAKALQYFWSITQCADALHALLEEENRRMREYPKLDGLRATPENLFKERNYRRALRPEDRWYFMPVKRSASIRKGVIQCKVDHYRMPIRFLTYEVPGFPVLRERHPVLVAFHPGKTELGCHVFNAATGPAAQGMAWGEFMGIVPHFRDTPEEVLHTNGDFSQTSKANAHLRAEYRTIVPSGTGPGTLRSVARDGLGSALTIQKGGASQPDTVILPPPPIRTVAPAPAAWSSRAVPATREGRTAEIARLRAQLEAAM